MTEQAHSPPVHPAKTCFYNLPAPPTAQSPSSAPAGSVQVSLFVLQPWQGPATRLCVPGAAGHRPGQIEPDSPSGDR